MPNTPAKLAKVIELCEQAISEGLNEENNLLAKQFLAASALQKAKLAVQQLPKVARNPAQLRRLKGDLMADIKKAIDNDPALAEAQLLAAQITMLPPEDSIAAWGMSTKLSTCSGQSSRSIGRLHAARAVAKRRHGCPVGDLRLATEADPTNMAAWQLRITMQLGLGKLDEAYADIQKLLSTDSDNEFAVQAAFETLLKLKKYDELIALLDKQIESQPKEGRYYRLRATARIVQSTEKSEKDLLKQARPDLDKAIELNSRDSQALVLRSQVLFDLGELDQARRDIGDALLIDPNAVDGIFMRAAIAAREERYADAISDMEMLVRAFPTREGYVRQLANYYQLDGRPRLAIRLMDELISATKTAGEICGCAVMLA